jgi:hypothetical protein
VQVPVEKKVQVLVPVPQVKQVIEKYPVEVGKRIVEVSACNSKLAPTPRLAAW